MLGGWAFVGRLLALGDRVCDSATIYYLAAEVLPLLLKRINFDLRPLIPSKGRRHGLEKTGLVNFRPVFALSRRFVAGSLQSDRRQGRQRTLGRKARVRRAVDRSKADLTIGYAMSEIGSSARYILVSAERPYFRPSNAWYCLGRISAHAKLRSLRIENGRDAREFGPANWTGVAARSAV